MKVKFTQREFDKLRAFQDRMAKEFGETAYVGPDHAVVLVDYSPQLREMIRPMPKCNQFEFELLQLECEDCKVKALFLAVPGETKFVCNDCLTKRSNEAKKKKKAEEAAAKKACVVFAPKADDLQEGFTPQ